MTVDGYIAGPNGETIDDSSGLLVWKANDRAIATFKSMKDITSQELAMTNIVNEWLKAASG